MKVESAERTLRGSLAAAVAYTRLAGLVVAMLMLVVACSDTPILPGGDTARQSGCANFCEDNDWPEVIIGFYEQDAGALDWEVSIRQDDDVYVTNLDEACPVPGVPPPYVCSYTSDTYPGVRWVDVVIQTDTGVFERRVRLREFNRCARNIAYVPVSQADASRPKFGPVEYISPCSMVW